ncbi:MAG: gliding motility-associated protein GldE [Bacteroidales bacterium]
MDTIEPFQHFGAIIARISFEPVTGESLSIFAVGLFVLIILALVSGAEDAFFSIIPAKLKELKKNLDPKNNKIVKLLESPQFFKATIIILKNLLYVAIFISWGFIFNIITDIDSYSVGIFLGQIATITILIILFKDLASQLLLPKNKVDFARSTVGFFTIMHRFLLPLSKFLVNSTSIVTKKLLKRRKITLDELSEALSLSSEEINEDENILRGIIKFGNIDAKEIMKSRIDVIAVDINTEFNKLINIIIDSGHSRIPVYEETFDNVKGILYIKDLLPYMQKKENFSWQSLLRPPYFVPETKKINGLLKEFQRNKIHLAIVIDEYGGTYGIVTLEDILEEIVGEITDESDTDEAYYSKIDNNTYIFEGKTLLNDFDKILNIPDEFYKDIKGDADTIAGVILELKGEIPKKNETIQYKNLTFEIESSDKRRIKKVKVVIN